jgi:multidrug efflux pump subunit AcrB
MSQRPTETAEASADAAAESTNARAQEEGLARARAAALAPGPLAWMAKNPVAANVVMAILMIGGLVMMLGGQIRQEVFPEVELDVVTVSVPYPGASPEEVEQGVLLAIEEAVRGLDGVKEVRSTAMEGTGAVTVELLLGTNPDRALSDVKSAVDRITSLPEDAERPIISLATNRNQVISLVLYGDVEEAAMRQLAERARNDLLADKRITQVELAGVRAPEVSVEIPLERLRQHGLTLEGVAQALKRASVDLPGGDVKTRGGELLLRTKERRDKGSEFENIVLQSRPDGTVLKVGDIATVKDGFAEVDRAASFNGKPAVMLNVFRVGAETPLDVSAAVREYAEAQQGSLPPGLEMTTWSDSSEIYRDRIDLLARNAYMGLVLVLLTLGLFLEIRLAFWVTLGIPISFLGGLMFMPAADVSLNMISLFAFILTLGMVVDDAIVVGEAAYKRLAEGFTPVQAAIAGAREVAVPVVFAILTTCTAFAPLLFVPGVMGKFFRVIPTVVILVLLISLVESLLVLPAHLAHVKRGKPTGVRAFIHEQQQRFSRVLERFIDRTYRPFLEACLRMRYLTIAASLAVFVAAMGLVAGGRLQFTFFPKIDSDVVEASLEMPVGTPADETRRMQDRMVEALREVLHDTAGGKRVDRGIFADLGAKSTLQRSPNSDVGNSGGHLSTVMVYLVPTDERPFSASQLAKLWRERIGSLPGVEQLTFNYSTGGPSGSAIDLELSHPNDATLERAAERVADALSGFSGVTDIDKGFVAGKSQLDFKLTPEGRALGLTEIDLARQVRSAFYGAEAVRQQRGRDEIRVFVRLPKEDRQTLHTLEGMVLLTPQGKEIPLSRAAQVEESRAYTRINRTDGRRTLNVTADVVPGVANANEVVSSVLANVLPEVARDYPGLSYGLGGQQQDQAETLKSLGVGTVLAMVAIFAMLAIVFRSYLQPVIVMAAIPFGLVGSVLGHLLMGYDMSLMSMMGLVALAGVAVNDSLVLIAAINEYRTDGMSLVDAVVAGGTRRFRPILLTSLTTFLGLAPMIMETSVQARFLIPMALSLGFGVLFATVVTLLFVPALYLALDDGKRLLGKVGRFVLGGSEKTEEPAPEA